MRLIFESNEFVVNNPIGVGVETDTIPILGFDYMREMDVEGLMLMLSVMMSNFDNELSSVTMRVFTADGNPAEGGCDDFAENWTHLDGLDQACMGLGEEYWSNNGYDLDRMVMSFVRAGEVPTYPDGFIVWIYIFDR